MDPIGDFVREIGEDMIGVMDIWLRRRRRKMIIGEEEDPLEHSNIFSRMVLANKGEEVIP